MDNDDLVTIIYDGEEMLVSLKIMNYLEENRKELRRQSEEDRRHKSDKKCTESFIEDFMTDKPAGFEDELIRRMEAERLREAIAALPTIQRRRLAAYFFEGFTYQKIADMENVNVSVIYKSVNRAIAFLKKYF